MFYDEMNFILSHVCLYVKNNSNMADIMRKVLHVGN